jgi:hypothetical protein
MDVAELQSHAHKFPGENVCVYVESSDLAFKGSLIYALFDWDLVGLAHKVTNWTWATNDQLTTVEGQGYRIIEFTAFQELVKKPE